MQSLQLFFNMSSIDMQLCVHELSDSMMNVNEFGCLKYEHEEINHDEIDRYVLISE